MKPPPENPMTKPFLGPQALSELLRFGIILTAALVLVTQAHTSEIPPPTPQPPQTLAVIRVKGIVTEAPQISPWAFTGRDDTNFADLTKRLLQAAQDPSVHSVLLSFEQPIINWAQIDELRWTLEKLRSSGKKTYAYCENISQLEYLLACACDEIIMTRTGHLMLSGLAGQAVYFKNLLDKLDLEADLIQMGDSKGAAEPLTLTGPSEPQREQMDRLFDSLYEHFLDSIAASRHLERRQVARLVDIALFSAQQAQENALIDHVMYRDEFLSHLQTQNDRTLSLLLDYGLTRPSKLPLDNPFTMIASLQSLLEGPPEPPGDAIAVVYLDGIISDGESRDDLAGKVVGSETLRKTLKNCQSDQQIKAIVVRIDSPGGSATASDIIYKAIRECAAAKPVIVSMGRLAASGGYYTACGAKIILAEPSTITGSVGVVGGKIVLTGLLNKLGITTYPFQRGQRAHMFSPLRSFTSLERLDLTRHMQEIYQTFKNCVVESRGDKLTDSIDLLAQGKVYTGLEAQQNGMVDQLGGLRQAVELAAELAGAKDYHLRVLPQPKSLMEFLEDLLAQADPPTTAPAAAFLGEFLNSHHIAREWALLQRIGEPIWREILLQACQTVTLLNQEQVLLLLPCEILTIR